MTDTRTSEQTLTKCRELAEQLTTIEAERYHKQYPDSKFSSDVVTVKDRGKKFAAIDIGTSGAWLIEKATGEIFNIKAYGVPDYNKKQKANIGNVFTVDPRRMSELRYNYLR